MRLKVLFLLVLCGVSVQACGDDEESAPPGRSVGDGTDGGRDSGGLNPFIPGGDGDGDGDDDGGEEMDSGQVADAGGDSGVGPSRCRDFEAVPPGTDPDPLMTFNLISTPTDFVATSASATWNVDCANPTLTVTLSSGDCPDGDGHQITFFVPAKGVEDSTVVLGQNVLMEDSPGRIRVRYTRPTRITPNGEWGSCTGVNGTLDLRGELKFIKGRSLQGDFVADLTRCDGGDPGVQSVAGQFNVEVPASLTEICPP